MLMMLAQHPPPPARAKESMQAHVPSFPKSSTCSKKRQKEARVQLRSVYARPLSLPKNFGLLRKLTEESGGRGGGGARDREPPPCLLRVRESFYISIYLYLLMYPSIYLSLHLLIYLYLSVYISICFSLSIYLSNYGGDPSIYIFYEVLQLAFPPGGPFMYLLGRFAADFSASTALLVLMMRPCSALGTPQKKLAT